ncbi:MAG: hypothetical protein HYU99_05495 [Deltaproteobacteria bacterium]|nr:hypothetical protein [Deltaproteobacteria bacterium]
MKLKRDDDMMDDYCPHCGAFVGGDSICPNCGKDIFDDSGLEEVDEDEADGPTDVDEEDEPGGFKH